MRHLRHAVLAAPAVLLALIAAGAATATAVPPAQRVPSPATGLLPNGRQLVAHGAHVTLGNLPTGGALTPDGRYLWTVSAGIGSNDVRIVDTVHRRVCQILPVPGASGGIAIDAAHRLAYVSGLANSLWQPSRSGLPGAAGDIVLVIGWTAGCGDAHVVRVIKVPPPAGAPTLQAFPAVKAGTTKSWPQKLAVSPDGTRLLVPLNLADHAAVIDLDRGDQVRYVDMGSGSYPFGAAVLPDGRTGLVSNEATGTLAVVDMASAGKRADITVGPPLSHPQGIAVNRAGTRAYVALSAMDEVAVVDLRRRRVERTVSVGRSAGLGTIPVAVALSPREDRLYVAESGADEIAVIRLRASAVAASPPFTGRAARSDAWTVVGRIPTADQPQAVLTAAAHGARPAQLLWVAAKGVGVGPNVTGPDPVLASDPIYYAFHPIPLPTFDIFDAGITYLANEIAGRAGLLTLPTDAHVRRLTPAASRQLQPIGAQPAPAGTPLRRGGPIKHVFFVVRENRTYDQVLGALGRGNGDPKLEVFDRNVTPNMHALLGRFPLMDNVMADSDASIDGHYWTAAASVPDYVNRNWEQYYSGRRRPNDFGMYDVSYPGNGFLFDQAERQHISSFNYGEALDGGDDDVPDRNRTAARRREVARVGARSDLGPGLTAEGCYPSDQSIGTASDGGQIFDASLPAGAPVGSHSHIDCLRTRLTAQLAAGDVPALNYVTFTSDHTRGTEVGYPTPSAMMADSDQAVGELVDTVSHSSIWKSSAIFVVEDDSQDGADHVNAHRIPAMVISPYARRGVVLHTRYDLLSVVRSMELILGMRPLSLNDALATPMYDVFTAAPANAAPVTAIPARIDLLTPNRASAPNARLSARLPLEAPDRVPQWQLDRILWQSVHGSASAPPPPGPDAADGQ